MIDGRVLTAGLMLAIFAVMIAVSFAYPAEARAVPLLIGIAGAVLSGIQLISELQPAAPRKVFTAEQRRREIRMFGWFGAFLAGIILFGFEFGAPVLVALYLHYSRHERWGVALGSAAFTWMVMYGVFDRALHLPVFHGLIVQRYFT
jgi:hypothetical protein